jgi:hypothetical protein
MKNKTLLSLCALTGILNFQGCSNDLESQLNKGVRNQKRAVEQAVKDQKQLIPSYPATLTKNESIGWRGAYSLLYFDLDGNPDTTELVMRKDHCCLSMVGKLNDVKIGETKTIQEWYSQITQHKGCTSNYYRRYKADVKLLDR